MRCLVSFAALSLILFFISPHSANPMPSQKYAPLDGGQDGFRIQKSAFVLDTITGSADLLNSSATLLIARPFRVALLTACCLCFLVLAYNTFRPFTDNEIRLECRQKLGPRKVHVVLPASTSSPRFCRSLSTLLINNYEPIIINWNGESHHSSRSLKY